MTGFILGTIMGAVLGVIGIGIIMGGSSPSVRDSAYTIKGMCSEHPFCGECPAFHNNECIFENAPLTWKVDKLEEDDEVSNAEK